MIWQQCQGQTHIKPIDGLLFRLVESQEQVATQRLVDDLDEQALLEQLLEQSKPKHSNANIGQTHYLLSTPFRYPPLKYGSRFGGRHEPSLFYGGCSEAVTLVESAYYRFVFWSSMSEHPTGKKLRSQHTMFSVPYATKQGIRLHQSPFLAWQETLRHPSEYAATQQLGADMRGAGVAAFEYVSARDQAVDQAAGLCVALFTPNALAADQPSDKIRWQCEVDANKVSFKQQRKPNVHHFMWQDFLVGGVFPMPA